jgi:hypothetical protein
MKVEDIIYIYNIKSKTWRLVFQYTFSIFIFIQSIAWSYLFSGFKIFSFFFLSSFFCFFAYLLQGGT